MSAEFDETTALLIRARGFLERGWCREAIASDGEVVVRPNSDRAVSWCAEGALIAAGAPDNGELLLHPAYLRLREAMGRRPASFNDDQETVEPVLAAFDRAIAGQSAEGALHPSKTEG